MATKNDLLENPEMSIQFPIESMYIVTTLFNKYYMSRYR